MSQFFPFYRIRSSRIPGFVALLFLALTRADFAQIYTIQSLGPIRNDTTTWGRALNASGRVTGVAGTGNLSGSYLFDGPHMLNLGTLGGNTTNSFAINASGQIAGWAEIPGDVQHAFLYRGVGLIDLGTLGGATSAAENINDAGQVTGQAQTKEGYSHAFLYTGAKMVDLGTLGGTRSVSRNLNQSGQVAGESDTTLGYISRPHAFLYTNGKMRDLGTLGGNESSAYALNDRGQVTGWAKTADNQRHGFLFDGIHMVNLDLVAPTGTFTIGSMINARGQIAGRATSVRESHFLVEHAFLYDGLKVIDLGTLGGDASFANDLDSRGQVVGASSTSSLLGAPFHACLYNGTRLVDLNTMIAPHSGWVLEFANAINERGQIMGNGYFMANGIRHEQGFLLTPVVGLALTLSENSLYAGDNPTATLTLPTPAPPGGAVVSITSNTNAALIPPRVTIPAGQVQATFAVQTTPVAAPVVSTIRAMFNGVTRYANLTTYPPDVQKLTLSPESVQGGGSGASVLTLTGPAPAGGLKVYLSSNTAAVWVPATLTVPAGARSLSFTVRTNRVSKAVQTTLKVSCRARSVYAFLTVKP